MEDKLDILLGKFLQAYPDAKGIMFTSMENSVNKKQGELLDILELYKDIPMMSIDESFNTSFSFIVTESGTIIIFFVKKLNFISVFVEGENPNKELALRMYANFRDEFENLVDTLV